MIQETLLQSYGYTRKSSFLLNESTTERDLLNGAKVTDTSKQIIHNAQKIKVDASWREVSGKKRN